MTGDHRLADQDSLSFLRIQMTPIDRKTAETADLEALLDRVKRSTARATKAIEEAPRFVADSETRIRRLESGRGRRKAG
jgi:hypothetical protein